MVLLSRNTARIPAGPGMFLPSAALVAFAALSLDLLVPLHISDLYVMLGASLAEIPYGVPPFLL